MNNSINAKFKITMKALLSGAHLVEGFDMPALFVVMLGRAGRRAQFGEWVCSSPRRCGPDGDFILIAANRLALRHTLLCLGML